MTSKQFKYTSAQAFPGLKGGLPFVPLALTNINKQIVIPALVDSGSTVNVLPYDVGIELGLDWEEQDISLPMVGIMWGSPVFGVVLMGQLEDLPPIPLAFAWTQRTSSEIPLILGQVNFFQQYRTNFDGKKGTFEIILD